MTGWKKPAEMEFGTTALDSPDRRLEDFVAVPDLVAGALAHLARRSQFRRREGQPSALANAGYVWIHGYEPLLIGLPGETSRESSWTTLASCAHGQSHLHSCILWGHARSVPRVPRRRASPRRRSTRGYSPSPRCGEERRRRRLGLVFLGMEVPEEGASPGLKHRPGAAAPHLSRP